MNARLLDGLRELPEGLVALAHGADLGLEAVDVGKNRSGIDVDPGGGRKRVAVHQPAAGLGLLVLEGRDRAPLLMKITTTDLLFGPEGRKLGAIVHAEHPGARIVDRAGVVLVVSCVRVLHEARLRHGAARGGEGLGRLDAGEVVVASKDALEPLGVHAVGDPDLADDGIVRKASRLLDDRAARPQQAHVGAPVGAVDDTGNSLEVFGGHENRKGERPERAFESAPPGDLLGEHLDEFARKGQVRGPESRLGGDPLSDPELHGGNARALRLERLDFLAEDVELALDAVLFADEGLDLRVPRLLQVGGTRLFSGGSLDERTEFVGRGRQGLAELARGCLDLAALAHRAVAVLFATGLFGLPAGDLIAAALALAKLKVGERAAPCDEIGLNRADVLLVRAALVLELRGLSGQKVRAPGLAVGGERLREELRAATALFCLLHVAERRLGGREHADLGVGGHDGAVRGLELDELVDETGGDRVGARLVEHEVPQEFVEVAEVLRGLRLVKELERKAALDAEERREGGLVGREEVRAPGVAQIELETPEVVVGLRKAGDEGLEVDVPLDDGVEALDVAHAVELSADPEDLQKRHGAAGVAESEREARGGRLLAQVLRRHARIGLKLGPRAADVGDDRAVALDLAARLMRGGVEVHPAGRNQQLGEGVEKRRLARARGAHEEKALFGDRNVVEAREGAPVVYLQAHGPELFFGHELGEKREIGHSRPSASSSSSSDSSFSMPAGISAAASPGLAALPS